MYSHLIFHIRTYYVYFIWCGSYLLGTCALEEIIFSFDHTSKDGSILLSTIWNDFITSSVSINILYLTLFLLIHPPSTFLRIKIFILLACFINISSYPNPRILQVIILDETFWFLSNQWIQRGFHYKISAPISIWLMNDKPWFRWLPLINIIFTEVPRSHLSHSIVPT